MTCLKGLKLPQEMPDPGGSADLQYGNPTCNVVARRRFMSWECSGGRPSSPPPAMRRDVAGPRCRSLPNFAVVRPSRRFRHYRELWGLDTPSKVVREDFRSRKGAMRTRTSVPDYLLNYGFKQFQTAVRNPFITKPNQTKPNIGPLQLYTEP